VITATNVILQCFCVVLEYIVVTATVDVVQCYCVLCGDYCGFRNSRYSAKLMCCVGVYFGYINRRYSAMVLCCVCRLLRLKQQ